MPLDGLLVVDKPVGPTSHDVVSRARRILKERRIGHTGTLDPLASGVLLLVVGRATRLARFLNSDAKRYEAAIRLGFATDTYDALGRPATPAASGPMPTRAELDEALASFRGTFEQEPPAFSAKKIDGRRSYRLARAQPVLAVRPSPVMVSVSALDVTDFDGDTARVDITCSSGFYVRSLAHDLGVRLGVGAHLAALRRVEAGGWSIEKAARLSDLEDPEMGSARARAALVPLPDVLPGLPAVTLTPDGLRRAASGAALEPRHALSGQEWAAARSYARLLDPSGRLVGVAEMTRGRTLHPVVVLM
jgi:tRNA pseudouridine55 synthase